MKEEALEIRGYKFGEIILGGEIYNKDIIFTANKVLKTNWRRKKGHELCLEDLEDFLDYPVIFVGTGTQDRVKAIANLSEELVGHETEIVMLPTPKVIELYHWLSLCESYSAITAFALHLTC
jgi:hypothetical protein